MKNLLLAACFVLAISACHTSGEKPTVATATTYTVPDDAAIKKAVDDAYYAISFKKGEQPRYDSIKYYFTPQAQLINFRTDTAETGSITEFVGLFRKMVEGGHISMFYEEEEFGRTEQFGRIASRISTYNTYLNTRDSIAERGVNSFQLIKTPTGWKVSSIIWDVEKKTLPVPDYYLKK
ncbi:hypothetical protein FFF34_010455 [Inquilinus sp. KBS0705]|nr:hypothetical protein FFF34_010455 [Inquilinus sp. KBS0705]